MSLTWFKNSKLIRLTLKRNTFPKSKLGSQLNIRNEWIKYVCLDSVDLNTGRGKIKKRDIVLGKISLSREKDETEPEDWKYIEGRIKFSEPVSQSWDHIPGTSKGIDTETRLRNRTYQFPWGMEWNGDEVGERRVGANLQPGTKIDITLEEIIYFSKIKS